MNIIHSSSRKKISLICTIVSMGRQDNYFNIMYLGSCKTFKLVLHNGFIRKQDINRARQ